MKTWARIENGVVAEVFAYPTNPVGLFVPGWTWVACPAGTMQQATYSGKKFVNPETPPPPPPPEPAPEALLPLTPRRFWLAALSLGITEEMVDEKIEALPEPQRAAAKIEKRHAQTYEREHPLVQSLPSQFDITADALDEAWRNAPA